MTFLAKILEPELLLEKSKISSDEMFFLKEFADKIANIICCDIEINFVYDSIYNNLKNDERIKQDQLSQLEKRSFQWLGKIIGGNLLKDEFRGMKLSYILRGGGNSTFYHEISHFLDKYPRINHYGGKNLFYWDL